MNLLPNKRLEELSKENDQIGVFYKADFLKEFFINIKSEDDLKMFCLFGDWGSGKSTVLKYLEKNLKDDYNTFFFEAWEHDHTQNIAYSLMEFLVSNTDDSLEKDCKSFLKATKIFFKGLGKSTEIEIGLPKLGNIKIAPKDIIEEFDKDFKTHTQLKEEFKKDFRKIEDLIIAKAKGPKKNIVFIDDLDRCNPEQTLSLLTAIKLFFTYGEKTIYVCGVDKKAVEEAIKTKYHDYIKSHEYLEKIFDISFSMPKQNDIDKLISVYFDDLQALSSFNKSPLNEIISDFFKFLKIQNPRKIKKILNKYDIISKYSFNIQRNKFIYIKESEHYCLLETIIILYLIILYEFFPETFIDFIDFDKKMRLYSKNSSDNSGILNAYIVPPLLNTMLKDIRNYENNKNYDLNLRVKYIFSPLYIDDFKVNMLDHKYANKLDVSKNSIELYFYKFIFYYLGFTAEAEVKSENTLFDLKKLIEMMG